MALHVSPWRPLQLRPACPPSASHALQAPQLSCPTTQEGLPGRSVLGYRFLEHTFSEHAFSGHRLLECGFPEHAFLGCAFLKCRFLEGRSLRHGFLGHIFLSEAPHGMDSWVHIPRVWIPGVHLSRAWSGYCSYSLLHSCLVAAYRNPDLLCLQVELTQGKPG